MRRRPRRAINACAMLCAAAITTGCATSGQVGGDYCLLTDFIWLSPDDSDETAEQVILHNERREAVCGRP